jgi:stearoyl-CoA desaturase (delta-9 desaturase)
MASPAVTKSSERPSHITDEPLTISNWHQQISWINVTFVAGIPLFGFIMAYYTPLIWKTAIWTLIYYFCTGLGITAGKMPWFL